MDGEKKPTDFAMYAMRRKQLLDTIKQEHPKRSGIVLLLAGFEKECSSFRQDPSFFYLTGLQEPGLALVMDMEGHTHLYAPNCLEVRAQWMTMEPRLTQDTMHELGIDELKMLGDACTGYQFHPFFPRQEYKHLLELIATVVARGDAIFTLSPNNPNQYVEQRLVLERSKGFVPGLEAALVDISPSVAEMRRKKDLHEIGKLYAAIETTMLAHGGAAEAILQEGVRECEIQAALEYVMTASGARIAFPSIVATGKNATVLHYTANNQEVRDGELVIVDIGAEQDGYCADLTRTYPVSGTFTKRQKELYNLVLSAQEYIAGIAKPGYWLSNKDNPEKSLNHLAKKYFEERGYGQYFLHGIGHFLGLDVHDVGDYTRPLQAGDVITIEPGLYIAQEGIGIRIEDNYWITQDGVVCLSESLPKTTEDIERLMETLRTGIPEEAQEHDEDENDEIPESWKELLSNHSVVDDEE